MKLFEVTRWGNAVDGGDGPDTSYLVCACDHEEAAALVRPREPDLDAITELGECGGEVEEAVVLRGPYVEHALPRGTHFTLWTWDPRGLDVWVPSPSRRDGEATCRYANGNLAARCTWRDGRPHGASELWYANGQLMHTGEHRRGRVVGVHEYWYADGTRASRYEYVAGGVRTQEWDRGGNMVREAAERWDADGASPAAAADRRRGRVE